MRFAVYVVVLLSAVGCTPEFSNPLGLSESGDGGGGGGRGPGGYYRDIRAKRLQWNVTVVSAVNQQPLEGARLMLVYRDDYEDTTDETIRTDVTDHNGYGMVGKQTAGNMCVEDMAWSGYFLDVEAAGFDSWSEELADAGCWSRTVDLVVELTPK